ncbi:MAG: hypothetical protein WDN27_04340 [Candidatus Saccharibacteria bacterium]
MSKIHQKLQLQHRRHTGRLLQHKHTSYHGLAIIVVLGAFFIVGLNVLAKATADSFFNVYATVPATMPVAGAVITSPAEGAVINSTSLTVHGDCPDVTPRVVIVLTLDGVSIGSMACDSANQFTFPVTVSGPGEYTLVAQSWTITFGRGPDSAPVHFRAFSPIPAAGSRIDATNLPVIKADQAFLVYGPTKDAVWTGTITGINSPFKFHIDWGDGGRDTYTVTNGEKLSYHHHYNVWQSYDITVQVTDRDGNVTTEHFAAVTPYRVQGLTGLGTSTPTPPPYDRTWFGSLYGLYLMLLAFFGWLWVRRHPRQYAFAKVPVHSRSQARGRQYAAAKRRHYRDGKHSR